MAGLTQNYHETLDPAVFADEATITLAATYKALLPTARYSQLGTQFFNRAGRKLRITAFGKITTVLTPGNGQIGILFGTNADANGVTVCQSAAFALSVSQTNLSWKAVFDIHARSLGATGTLFGEGIVWFNNAVVANTLQPILIPASAAAASSSVDLTGTLVPSLQFLRSGSTAETITVQDYTLEPLN
jgi:hypothetical protein